MLPQPLSDCSNITRASSPELDKILGLRFPVLDKGWVSPIDYMGNDRTPAKTARVSTKAENAEKERALEQDTRLLTRLYKDKHTSPFEGCELRIVMKLPLVVLRQIMRHRTFSYNEQSGRYSVFDLEFYYPQELKLKNKRNKQMADMNSRYRNSALALATMKAHNKEFADLYSTLIDDDVAKEQARLNMPLNAYTVVSMKGNLLNWLKFLALRTAEDVQPETREYALLIEKILTVWVPEIMNIRYMT